jgi:hypothetical protein
MAVKRNKILLSNATRLPAFNRAVGSTPLITTSVQEAFMATHLIPVIGKALFSAPPPSSSPAKEAPAAPAQNAASNEEQLERERRLEALRRRRRGVTGTIATSPRGLLASREMGPNRRSLLGE